MSTNIRNCCRSCERCQRVSPKGRVKNVPLMMPILTEPFPSQLMGELHRLIGVTPLFTTPYHPMCTGRIERIHSTLKAYLKKLCVSKPKDWHRYLVPTLFALREMLSDRSGFSPFELLYWNYVINWMTALSSQKKILQRKQQNPRYGNRLHRMCTQLVDCLNLPVYYSRSPSCRWLTSP